MRRALAATWALVTHPLRSSLSGPSRRPTSGVYNDRGAMRATRRRRGWWWVLQFMPSAIWLGLAVWRYIDGELALGIAYTGAAFTLAVVAFQIRTAYLSGYLRGALQATLDVRHARNPLFYLEARRVTPHPADPTPDMRTPDD